MGARCNDPNGDICVCQGFGGCPGTPCCSGTYCDEGWFVNTCEACHGAGEGCSPGGNQCCGGYGCYEWPVEFIGCRYRCASGPYSGCSSSGSAVPLFNTLSDNYVIGAVLLILLIINFIICYCLCYKKKFGRNNRKNRPSSTKIVSISEDEEMERLNVNA